MLHSAVATKGVSSTCDLSVHEEAVPGAAQRRNPLALGHMANHPGKEDVPNVMIAAFDYDVPPGAGAALQSSSILGPAKQAAMPGMLGSALSASLALYYMRDCSKFGSCSAGSEPCMRLYHMLHSVLEPLLH